MKKFIFLHIFELLDIYSIVLQYEIKMHVVFLIIIML